VRDEEFRDLLDFSFKDKELKKLVKKKNQAEKKIDISEYPPPQKEIDLHGLTGKEAETKSEIFLLNSYRERKKCVRIIFGKGIHSKEKPVLPGVVEAKLIEMKKKRIVFSFKWDKKERRKSGSVIVYLESM